MSKFKVGDKVVRVCMFKNTTWRAFKNQCQCNDDDVFTVTQVAGGGGININNFKDEDTVCPFAPSFFKLVEPGTSEPAVAAWDFSEAQRLRDAAKAAVEAYNEYVANKPEDTYLKVYNPFQD